MRLSLCQEKLRNLTSLPDPFELPQLPIRIQIIAQQGQTSLSIFSRCILNILGQISSVLQDIVHIYSDYLLHFNISTKKHYSLIRSAFATEFNLNEFNHSQVLVGNVFSPF
jgi:hypothetical protein